MSKRMDSLREKVNATVSGVKEEILDYNKVDERTKWYSSVKELFEKVREKGKGSLPAVKISEIDLGQNIRDIDLTSSDFKALKESIKEQGLLQRPVLTLGVSSTKPFLCVAGHRRIYALKELAIVSTPAELIFPENEQDIHLARLAENLVRQNLKPLELAESVFRLKDRLKTTTAGVARLLKKERMYVTQLLKMASWPDEAKRLIHENDINVGRLSLVAKRKLSNEEVIAEIHKILDSKVRDNPSPIRKGAYLKPRNKKRMLDYFQTRNLESETQTIILEFLKDMKINGWHAE